MLRNKAAFLWLVDTYGELVPFEQIEFIADRLDRVHYNSVDIDLRFTIFGQVWTYLMSQSVQGRDCLRHFLWLNPKTNFLIQSFRDLEKPLTEKTSKKYAQDCPNLKVAARVLATHAFAQSAPRTHVRSTLILGVHNVIIVMDLPMFPRSAHLLNGQRSLTILNPD